MLAADKQKSARLKAEAKVPKQPEQPPPPHVVRDMMFSAYDAGVQAGKGKGKKPAEEAPAEPLRKRPRLGSMAALIADDEEEAKALRETPMQAWPAKLSAVRAARQQEEEEEAELAREEEEEEEEDEEEDEEMVAPSAPAGSTVIPAWRSKVDMTALSKRLSEVCRHGARSI